jgi:ribosome recycling factor
MEVICFPFLSGSDCVSRRRDFAVHDWKPKMQQTVRLLAEQLRGLRTGSVDPGFISSIRANCQGNRVPLSKLGSIRPQGDRILIAPFDPANLSPIVRALSDARLSAYALNPTTVCVSVPPVSTEQRQQTIAHVKSLGEEARIAIRSIRQQARKQIDASGRGSFRVVQEATDSAVEEIDLLIKSKVTELS